MRLLTLGTFDLFHYGHLRLLQRAATYGTLQVGVNSDRFVAEYKGEPPVYPEDHRLAIVRELACVHEAWLNDGPGRDLIEQLYPLLLVIGSDWHERDYLKQLGVDQKWVDERGIGVLYLPRTAGISSTDLKARLT